MGHPTIYPTGTTLYNPEKCSSGYTIFQALNTGALLIDMNGTEVHMWKGIHGFPNKILPGGYLFGSRGSRDPQYGKQDQVDLIQVDFDGKIVWEFNKYEYIKDLNNDHKWMARLHHDFQREGSSTGYYSPLQQPKVNSGNTLLLVHKNLYNKNISDKLLLDDVIIEIDYEGNIIWEWLCNEHFDELGFGEDEKKILFKNPNIRKVGDGVGDWMHINSMSTLGENKFYDNGDERFHPDNIIWSARESNIMAIVDKKTGKIVWKLGPDYTTKELSHIEQIIGQHHVHMIPRGLPGEGNILIFDNGGWAGYGAPNPMSLSGRRNARRDYSRVLEIDPVTLKIVWQYTPKEALFVTPPDSSRFYSPYISSAQRLENGNTLITEGSDGRIFEVSAEHEIVWEYISPYMEVERHFNMVYRAYRVPYEWIPQLEKPKELPVVPIDITQFRMKNAAAKGCAKEVTVEGTLPYRSDKDVLCIDTSDSKDRAKIYSVNTNAFTIATKEIIDTFQDGKKSLILFGGEFCANCKLTHNAMLNSINTFKNIDLYYVDATKDENIASVMGISSVPVLITYDGTQEVKRALGAKPVSMIIDLVIESFGKYIIEDFEDKN